MYVACEYVCIQVCMSVICKYVCIRTFHIQHLLSTTFHRYLYGVILLLFMYVLSPTVSARFNLLL